MSEDSLIAVSVFCRAEGAIGTAEYVGVSLKKVIKACGGLKDGAKHLEFYGADTYFKDNEVSGH